MSLSIHGLIPGASGPRPLDGEGRAGTSVGPEGRGAGGAAVRAPDPQASAVAPPPTHDVDPRLWEMLTREEKSFYVRHAMSGPLTYGPGTPSGASTAHGRQLGGRIDIRG